MLSPEQIHTFINDGFIKIEDAFPKETADVCRNILWKETKCDPDNPATWTQPVIRIAELAHEPFKQAANTQVLHDAFRQLAGDNWLPRVTLGSFPIRFPSEDSAGDTGWHVDASFPGDNPHDYMKWRINIRSKGRALLMLFLFSDVEEADAPTIIRIGSHLDVAKILAPAGEKGLSFMEVGERINTLPERKTAHATGKAGTVYLCHPFIVHAAQEHHGKTPKFMAQPPLPAKHDFNINEHGYSPVEKAIVRSLNG